MRLLLCFESLPCWMGHVMMLEMWLKRWYWNWVESHLPLTKQEHTSTDLGMALMVTSSYSKKINISYCQGKSSREHLVMGDLHMGHGIFHFNKLCR